MPINHCDEVSCYANLLMHFTWPMEREANLIPSGSYAAQYYAYVLANGLFSNYVTNYNGKDSEFRNY